jgi:hypothetical protein
MDWNAICARIAADLDTITGINAFDHVPDSIPTIAAIVGEIDIDFDIVMRKVRSGSTRTGTDQGNITIRLLVARYEDRMALKKLREFMGGSGASSVAQVLMNDRSLGGLVDDSALKEMKGNRMFEYAGERYYGIELTLFVIGDA